MTGVVPADIARFYRFQWDGGFRQHRPDRTR